MTDNVQHYASEWEKVALQAEAESDAAADVVDGMLAATGARLMSTYGSAQAATLLYLFAVQIHREAAEAAANTLLNEALAKKPSGR
jgi:hypothetical protein